MPSRLETPLDGPRLSRSLSPWIILLTSLVIVVGLTIPLPAVVSAATPPAVAPSHPPATGPGPSTLGTGVTITFDTEPITCGSITFNGATYATGQTATLAAGSYTATANSCTNSRFVSWENGGASGISIASPTAWTSSVTISASGTLYAVFQTENQFTVSFQTGPMNCGASMVFGGLVHGDGSSQGGLSLGTYNLSSQLCTGSGWSFAGWADAPTGGASFGSPSLPQTTVTVGRATTITANFINTAPHTLTLQNGPIGCGSITFSGVNYTYGQQVFVASGGSYSYHITANPCFYYGTSNYWGGPTWAVGSSGSLTVVNPGNNPTTMTESGNGTLSVTFYSQEQEPLNFVTGPTACGTIYVDGAAFTNGQAFSGGSAGATPGVYNLTAIPCGGFSFSSWNVGGSPGLSVARPSSAQTLLNVTTGGTLTANFTALPSYKITFLPNPEGCGQILFNGVEYTDGQATQVPAGTYDVQALPCTNFQPGNGWGLLWGVGPGTGISLASYSSASTVATISGSGVLQALFSSEDRSSLSFTTGPSTCGTIYVDGNGYTNGGSITGAGITQGDYNITAVPCGGYTFSQWSYSGSLTVGRASAATTTMHFWGASTLGAIFMAGTPSTVTFNSTPPACGAIIFDGGSYTNGQTVQVATGGAYPISATPCNDYSFSAWSSTPGLSVASLSSSSTTVTVNANGQLNVTFVYATPHYTVTFNTGPTTCGSITINGTTTYTNGQSAPFIPGVPYTITANPCGNSFTYWNTGGGVILGSSPATNPNSFTVTASGYLVATFATPTLYTLNFHTGPIACGSIVFNGAPYTDGQSVRLSPGTYTIGASSCQNFSFNSWEYIAGAGMSISSNIATLSSFSNVTALFASYTGYGVHVVIAPTTCGTVSVANNSLADGANINLSPGLYHVGDLTCANFAFHGWNSSGGVSIVGPSNNPAIINVTGVGALSATDLGTTLYPVTFATSPTTCGGVNFGLVNFANGQSMSLSAGSYEVGANLCPNTGFGSWQTEGALSSSGGGYLGAMMVVSGAGTLTARFSVYNMPQLYVYTAPTGCGTVTVANQSFSNGGSLNLPPGTTSLSATACAGYSFNGWTSTAGALVASPASATTTVTMNASGAVYANFLGAAQVRLTLYTSPTGCGGVLVNGADYLDGQTTLLTQGDTYNVEAPGCTNLSFSDWGTGANGNVTVVGVNWQNANTITVTGNGTLTADFTSYTQYTVQFSTGPSTCGSLSFGASTFTNGGSASAFGNYTISANPCAGYSLAFWSTTGNVSVASPGSQTTTADVTGPGSLTANFSAVGTYPVTITESGLPGGTAWNVMVGGNPVSSSTATNFLSLPNGIYPYTIGAVSQGAGTRWGASPASGTLTVNGAGVSLATTYSNQVYLTVSASPSTGGTASPSSGWYGYASIASLSALPAPGYVFTGWYGSGPGNYTGTSASYSLGLYAPETEVALFAPSSIYAYAVDFNESGLPAGANWSATLNGESLATTGSTITFFEQNVTSIPWSVQSPDLTSQGVQYTASQSSGTLSVSGTAVTQFIYYSPTYYLGVAAAPASLGSVTAASGWYGAGSMVTLTAAPNAGDYFTGWSGQGNGGYNGTSNPITLMLNGPVSETAVFATQSGTAINDTVGFATAPATCGSVTFAGRGYVSGAQNTSVLAGVYAIDATPCTGYVFQSWATTGALVLGAASAASTTLQVSGNGTLTATFVPSSTGPTYAVSFLTSPTSCGGISFGGNSYASGGQNGTVPAGAYSISTAACPGYTFASWSVQVVTGTLTVAAPSNASTTITVAGSGALKATFTGSSQKTGSTVSFVTGPSGCGTITLAGGSYGSGGSNTSVPTGTYSISASPCPNYAFESWSVSGQVTVASTSASSTTLTVSGSGTLTATFKATGSSPKTSGAQSPWVTYALIGVIIALVAAVLALLLRRRGSQKGTSPTTAPASSTSSPTTPPPPSPPSPAALSQPQAHTPPAPTSLPASGTPPGADAGSESAVAPTSPPPPSPPNASFCESCGASLAASATFCKTCGTKIGT